MPSKAKRVDPTRSERMKAAWARRRAKLAAANGNGGNGHAVTLTADADTLDVMVGRASFTDELAAYEAAANILNQLPGASRAVVLSHLARA